MPACGNAPPAPVRRSVQPDGAGDALEAASLLSSNGHLTLLEGLRRGELSEPIRHVASVAGVAGVGAAAEL
jgi:hypothetical protein